MLALQKQNYRDNEALDGMIDVDMSTTWVLSWLTLPQRNVNCFEAPLHSTAAELIARTLCAWRERDWGEGITTTTVSLHLFICFVSQLALYPLPHSPRRVLPSMTAPADSSYGYHVDGAAYWSYRIGCHGRKKYRPIPILPNICKYRLIPNNPIPVSFEP